MHWLVLCQQLHEIYKIIQHNMSATGLQQHTWCLRWSLPFTPSRQWLGSAIGCYSVMVGHKSLSQISQQRQTLSTDGVPVVRMATWERGQWKDTVSTFCFCCKLQIQIWTSEVCQDLFEPKWGHVFCMDYTTDLADSDWRPHSGVMGSVETAEPSPAELGTKRTSQQLIQLIRSITGRKKIYTCSTYL